MKNTYLIQAVKIAGGQSALARLLGGSVIQAHIWNWLNRDSSAPPAKYVLKIEKFTGVSRYDLRPDIYPRF